MQTGQVALVPSPNALLIAPDISTYKSIVARAILC